MTMDLQLKERLVGAVVLVLAAVVFIPMVLDGPGADRHVSQVVALPQPAAAEGGGQRHTVRLDLDSPATADRATAAETPAITADEPAQVDLLPQQQEPAAREPQPKPEAGRTATAPASAGDAPWTVQAGSFGQEDNAETLAARLRELGYPAHVSRFNDGRRVHYRVRIGGFASRDAAQAKADEIQARTGEPATPQPNR